MAVLLIFLPRDTPAQETPIIPIHIGVLAHRGNDYALQRWSPTVDYLNRTFNGYHFNLLPMDIPAMNRAVAANSLHFTLTNPGHYVELETRYGASRIATLKNIQGGAPLTQFGAVIFTRADRHDIQTLADLRGRRFAAVDSGAFGGFQMAWREIKQHDIPSLRDLELIPLGFPQDNVVRAVLNNRADAGSVRTGVLESMAMWGQIDLLDIKVLHPVANDFPFLLSTQLYPEWPFAQLPTAPADLAEKIAIALLSMTPDSEAAKAGDYAGWTIPLDYSPVHALLRELHAPPYQDFGKITVSDLAKQYWPWLTAIGIGFIIGCSLLVYVHHLNRRLHQSSRFLKEEIQEHKLIKQRLLTLNGRLQHLLTATPAMIYSCAPDRNCPTTFISDNVRAQLGYEPGEFLNDRQFWIEHVHPDDKMAVQKSMDTLLREGAHHREYRFRAKDGDYRWLHDDVRLVRDENNVPIEVVGYWVDITDKIKAQELLRSHENELAHCLRLTTMGEMATALAHDINQPLSAVRNYVQGCVLRLRAGQLDSQQLLHALEEVIGQTERAAAVVRNVRQFVSKEKPVLITTDINELVRHAVHLVLPEARNAGIPVHLHLHETPLPVMVNPTQIQQVIINIAHNAFEAMTAMKQDHRVLHVETGMDNNRVRVSLRDTGPGVPHDHLNDIFNAFYTTKNGGMGMGLSISRTIIESHEGRLWAEPDKPRGMVFTFTLPLARDNS